MTEADWNNCTDPDIMLNWLHEQGRLSDRKARLFGVACCRRLWALMADDRLRFAVETVERLADAQATLADRKAARRSAQAAQQSGRGVLANRVAGAVFTLGRREIRWAIPEATRLAAEAGAASRTEWLSLEWRAALKVERNAQSHVLRDLFGPLPFREVTFAPSLLRWNDGTIVRLAQTIYDERAFDRLPVLADALDESGGANPDLLDHCRSGGDHVRGCWAVDALLGKS